MAWKYPQRRLIGTFNHDTLPGKMAQLELTVDAEFIGGKLERLKTNVAAAVSECLPFHVVHWFDVDAPAGGMTPADRKGRHETVKGSDRKGPGQTHPSGGRSPDVPGGGASQGDTP